MLYTKLHVIPRKLSSSDNAFLVARIRKRSISPQSSRHPTNLACLFGWGPLWAGHPCAAPSSPCPLILSARRRCTSHTLPSFPGNPSTSSGRPLRNQLEKRSTAHPLFIACHSYSQVVYVELGITSHHSRPHRAIVSRQSNNNNLRSLTTRATLCINGPS